MKVSFGRFWPLLLVLFFGFHLSYGQKADSTTLTSTRVRLEGTQISVAVPPGFHTGMGKASVEADSLPWTAVMFMTLPVSMADARAGFTKKKLKESGVDVFSMRDTAIGGRLVYLLEGRQPAPDGFIINKIIYLIEYKDLVLVTVGYYPSAMPEHRAKIVGIMETATYAKSSGDVLSEMGFWIDTTGTGYHYSGGTGIGRGFQLRQNGDTTTGLTGTYFMVSEMQAAPKALADRAAFFDTRVKSFTSGFKGKASKPQKVAIDGIEGYQCELSGRDKTGNVHLLLTVLFSDDRYYMLFGQAPVKEPAMHKFLDLTGRFERR